MEQNTQEILIVRQHVLKVIKQAGFRMSHKTPTQLNEEIHKLIQNAFERAKLNGRKTIMPSDI